MSEHPELERVALANVAYKHDIGAGQLERVVELESGWDTTAQNPKSGATGIVQFIPATAKRLGTSTDAILSLTFAEQCDLVDRYLRGVRHPIGDDVYMAFAYPDAIGAPDDRVIGKTGGAIWKQNAGWRSADDGDVTAGSIRAYFLRAKSWTGKKRTSPIGLGGVLVIALCLFALRSRRT